MEHEKHSTKQMRNEIDKNYERSLEIMQIYLLKAKQKTIEA